MVQLSIADNGAGIPAELLPKVFDIFFTTKPSGTGLGLWLANRTLREHGGKIEVESAPGKGTKFTLTLPTLTLPMTHDKDRGATEEKPNRR